jgi:RNA polymerase sigma-70 factor (ECF subfamily)
MTQHGNEAFEAIVAPLAAERAESTDWSLNGFGELYISERDRLVAIANRYLKDANEAEDVVQDAFVKCAIAAPDLVNRDHAVAYLTRTVVNTALNVVRSTSRRAAPIEDLATANLDSREIDAWNPAADDALMRAADTALVTEALRRLPEQQRTALLLTASGDYSTKQVAEVLGVSEQQVYTHVSRARAALRRALESIVVDAETGMTAADQHSTVVKKAKANAKHIGQGVAALALFMAVGLGFWNYSTPLTVDQIQKTISAQPTTPTTPTTPTVLTPSASASAEPTATARVKASASASAAPTSEIVVPQVTINSDALRTSDVKVASALPGTDALGRPVGFVVADATKVTGQGMVTTESNQITATGQVVTVSDFMTVSSGVNVLLHQTLTWEAGALTYVVDPMVRVNGVWLELPMASRASERVTLDNGDVIITTYILVDANAASAAFAGPGMGTDATRLPSTLVVRIHTSSSGTPVYGEVVQVIDPLPVAN